MEVFQTYPLGICCDLVPCAIGLHRPVHKIILQIIIKRTEQESLVVGLRDLDQALDPAIQVTVHQIRATDIDLRSGIRGSVQGSDLIPNEQ